MSDTTIWAETPPAPTEPWEICEPCARVMIGFLLHDHKTNGMPCTRGLKMLKGPETQNTIKARVGQIHFLHWNRMIEMMSKWFKETDALRKQELAFAERIHESTQKILATSDAEVKRRNELYSPTSQA